MFGIVERDYKIKMAYSDGKLDSTEADPRTADLLDAPRREPLFGISQVILSTDGKAVLYVLDFYRSDRHNLVIRRLR
jgi:DNA-binding GntR family transcriptional regulator